MLVLENIDLSISRKKLLHGIDLEIRNGEFVSILGPSGCGKSTLLKTICGFLPHQSGRILSDGQCIDSLAVHLRDIVMVFQDLRLFPNLLAWENVAFPLKMRGIPKEPRRDAAYDWLRQMNLEGLEQRRTTELSGGQQQRVALARALAAQPKYLLLDEPFSGLDEDLKQEMRELLCAVHRRHRGTVLFVTHDRQEALMLSDRIAIMDRGEILQYGSPRELFEHPASVQVARYFGERNLLAGDVRDNLFRWGALEVEAHRPDGPAVACVPYNAIYPSPHGLAVHTQKTEYLGLQRKVTVQSPAGGLIFLADATAPQEPVDLHVSVNPASVCFLDP